MLHVKHFNIWGGYFQNALPPHPSILNWDEVLFSNDDKFLYAKSVTNYGRHAQYWTIKSGAWHFLYEGKMLKTDLNVVSHSKPDSPAIQNVYRFSYGDAGLTLEFLNPDTLNFDSTNITNTPIDLAIVW